MTKSESEEDDMTRHITLGSFSYTHFDKIDENFDNIDTTIKHAENLFHKLDMPKESLLQYNTTFNSNDSGLDIYRINEITELNKVNQDIIKEKDKEIQILQEKLKANKLKMEASAHVLSRSKIELKKKKTTDYQFKKITTLHNNIKVETIVCNFFPGKGKIGIILKKVNKKFYIKKVMKDSQCCKYIDIVQNLLISEVIWWTPGNNTGTRITASSSQELGQKIKSSFENGKNITIKFIIPSSKHKGLLYLEKVYVTDRMTNVHFLFTNLGKRRKIARRRKNKLQM